MFDFQKISGRKSGDAKRKKKSHNRPKRKGVDPLRARLNEDKSYAKYKVIEALFHNQHHSPPK